MSFNPFDSATGILGTSIATGANDGVSSLANRLLDSLLFLAYPLAFAGLVYSAYLLITSAGNPDAWAKAKKNIGYMVVGFFLIIFAAIFTSLLRKLFANS